MKLLSNSYIKLRVTHFDNYYSDFDPLSLNGSNAGRESWVIPAYQLIDLHAGYKFKLSDRNKLQVIPLMPEPIIAIFSFSMIL